MLKSEIFLIRNSARSAENVFIVTDSANLRKVFNYINIMHKVENSKFWIKRETIDFGTIW